MNAQIVTSPALPIQNMPLAFRWGVEDAKLDIPCLPELYFVHPHDLLQYAKGHQSVAGQSLLSNSIVEKYDFLEAETLTPAEYADMQDFQEYLQEQADIEFAQRGAW